jgi:hypothetical protein
VVILWFKRSSTLWKREVSEIKELFMLSGYLNHFVHARERGIISGAF